MKSLTVVFTLLIFLALPAIAADALHKDIQAAISQMHVKGGWAVHAGSSDDQVEIALRKTHNFIVTGLAYSPEQAESARKQLSRAKMYGTITIHEVIQQERLPFPDNSLALLLIDNSLKIDQQDALRVLRPPRYHGRQPLFIHG